ncbi:peptide transporter [Thermococcus sp. 21S7]|uniref:peptide transporter n=1 Tax=Thermococcus sp. 21S7 TaxID=1638221 RepID=UPI001439B850|nr:peptide transporter [Thermococcus sp. 21S7]NJE61379.1 peptide transporter [Thermococcus sp. 21S7]
MVKTKVKEKRKKKGEKTSLPEYYQKFKAYGLPLIVLILAYVGFRIRNVTSNYKTFLDPDTFFHYEMYKIAIHEWIPKYFAYAEPPTGIKTGGYLGLYTIQAMFYKIVSVFGYDQLGAFKLWPPFVGAMTIIGVYLLGRKLHSNWAGLWAAAFMMFSYANFSKTYSGNNRGEGPFMMFFLYAVFILMVYLDEREWNLKKILSGVLFLLLSVLYMAAWTGSQFGLGIMLLFAGVTTVVFFIFGMMDALKRFVRDFYPIYGLSLLIGLAFSRTGLIGIRSFIIFSIEGLVALGVLAGIMLYGERAGLNYSDKKHRFGTVAVIAVLGVLAFYGYFGRDLLKFLGGATQSNPLYQTVAELAKTDWNTIKAYYSIKTNDAIIFILSIVGFIIVAARFVRKLAKNDLTGHKEIFLVAYYAGSLYLLLLAVRFMFQASGAILLLAGVAIGEAFLFVENMKESVTTKALYAVLLVLLFLPLPLIGAQHMEDIAKNTARAKGSVPADWMDTLKWLGENSNPLDSATSWWDYGYWIESSLLSHRRSATDGGHAYDRRYIVADFFSHYGGESEQDFEAWELNYLIVWQQDIYKFNAISYLGGAITYGEYRKNPMFQVIPAQYIQYANESGKTVVYINTGKYAYQPVFTIDLARGMIVRGKGDIPYVLYVFQGYGILAYQKIAFSNFVRLAFQIPFSFETDGAQKLFANFKLVHNKGGVSTYEFRPFAVYRIERFNNGTWAPVYSTLGGGKLPLGDQKLRLWISAFGRDVKNATLIFEAYNGSVLVKREILAEGINMNHLNETPLDVNLTVPNATRYRFVLVQDGPVGVLNGPVYVNGNDVNPIYVLGEGRNGELKLTAAFREERTVDLYLRASIVYYVAPNGKDIYQEKFYLDPHQDIITYVPVKSGIHVAAGDNEITAQASMPEGVFEGYIQKLYQKYGKDKVVVVKKRVEPIFITKKEYVVWEG